MYAICILYSTYTFNVVHIISLKNRGPIWGGKDMLSHDIKSFHTHHIFNNIQTNWPMGSRDMQLQFQLVISNLYQRSFPVQSASIQCRRNLILIHVMGWCRQASSYHLHQCWPIFMTPYDVASLLWFKIYENSSSLSGGKVDDVDQYFHLDMCYIVFIFPQRDSSIDFYQTFDTNEA